MDYKKMPKKDYEIIEEGAEHIIGKDIDSSTKFIMHKTCQIRSYGQKDIDYKWLHCCDKYAEKSRLDFEILLEITNMLNPRYLHKTFDYKKDTELTEQQKMIKAFWSILQDPKLAEKVLKIV